MCLLCAFTFHTSVQMSFTLILLPRQSQPRVACLTSRPREQPSRVVASDVLVCLHLSHALSACLTPLSPLYVVLALSPHLGLALCHSYFLVCRCRVCSSGSQQTLLRRPRRAILSLSVLRATPTSKHPKCSSGEGATATDIDQSRPEQADRHRL